ncbi:V-type ATP synthase subunit I [Candidatus Woesearchaeota archaeon]|nr:V-type ATP synthase subunit I [Candidatus Woesearchaeota archaeon]
MSRVIIAGPNNVQETAVKELHDMKILHIVEHSKSKLADIGKPLESASKLSEILVKIRALISTLNIKQEEATFKLKKSLLEIESTTKKLSDEVTKNLEGLKSIEEQLAKKDAVKQELEILKDVNVPLEYFISYKSLAYFIGYIKSKYILTLREELSKITNEFMLFDSATQKGIFIVLFVDVKKKEQIIQFLQKAGFLPLNFIHISDFKGTALSNLSKIEEEISKLHNKIESVKKNLEKLSNEYESFLLAADKFLRIELEKAEAPLMFASTPSSFLIKGWIPTDDLSKSIERLKTATKNKILVHFEPAKKHDKVPIKLKNPKLINSFEVLMNLYTMPLYKELDPTFFLFLTFPILFGFMLGDFGYGLVTLIIALVLKKMIPKARHFFNIFILASLSTMIFGLIFGEFFGFEELFGREIPHLLSRSHELMPLLYIAIGIGVVHLNIGFTLGFINEFKSHGLVHAIYAKGSWFILQIGLVLLLYLYINSLINLLNLVIGIILLFIIIILMLYKGEGVRGPIEIPSLFSNTLSYARLMAIGVSSVQLAMVINHQSEQFFHGSPVMILFGVIILLIGHIINIGLGLLGSFLHSLRLHYVEFFSKFFHGGASKYVPFGIKKQN